MFQYFNFGIINFIFYFVIYSFLGWCAEVIYAYKNQRRFVNRGFLTGPLCPIYGFCLLSIVLLLEKFNGNILLQFVIATLSTSTIEYSTGYLLEKIFKTKYWDYTEDPFNLHGRICLHFSLMWGAFSLAIVRVFHPIITRFITSMTPRFEFILFYILIVALIFDFTLTIRSLVNVKLPSYNFQLDIGVLSDKYNSFFHSSFERYRRNITSPFSVLKEKFLNFKDRFRG